MIFALFLLIAVCSPIGAHAAATIPTADRSGSKDHELVQRFEGSIIVDYDRRSYDEVTIPLGRLEPTGARDSNNNRVVDTQTKLQLEGEYTRIVYVVPPGRSPLEVIRNYQQAIRDKGGEVTYECGNEGCGGAIGGHPTFGSGTQGVMAVVYPSSRLVSDRGSSQRCAVEGDFGEQRFSVGKFSVDNRELVVSALAYTSKHTVSPCNAFGGRTLVMVVVNETKAREQRMVTVQAEEMRSAIAGTGRVALYGIYFDTDKTDIKPESKPTLDQIAKLLKDDTSLNVLVVGHTDTVGTFEYNMDLSMRRAQSVVASLKGDYGIAAARMRSAGAGMMAPTASNENEEGRAKNRRVELVRF